MLPIDICRLQDEAVAPVMGFTRRALIGSTLVAASALAKPVRASEAMRSGDKTVSQAAARIDVHQHLLPPEFLTALAKHGMSVPASAKWSPGGAVAMMDQHGIATGILSLSTPGPHMGNDAEARLLTRQVNERLATLVAGQPDRFGMFASVPLPDVDGALDAIRHAYDSLWPDGVILLANNGGVYLGDPAFDPVMAELDRRHAVVFVHPGPLPGPPVKGIIPPIVDFLLDTTRASVNLARNGIPRRFPNLRIILSHAGGFLPFAAFRVSILSAANDPHIDANAMMADLSSFYFDTALSGSPTVLPSLLSFARPGHILFGSDWPYAEDKTVGFFTGALDAYPGLDAAGHAAINRMSAEALFPRLAKYRLG